MNNQNVIALPASVNFNPEQALLSALEFCRTDNLQDVLVIGYDADGDLLVRSSRMTRAEALFMAEKAKNWAMYGGLE
jgi:hypothetical protein